MSVAEYPTTPGADSAFQQVHAPATAVAVGGKLRAPEYLERRHLRLRLICTRVTVMCHGDRHRRSARYIS
jgi:hypothetical protein